MTRFCVQILTIPVFRSEHPVSDANVRLDVLGKIRGGFQLFAQCGHEDAQGGHVAVPTVPQDVLGDKRMRQYLPHISGEEAPNAWG